MISKFVIVSPPRVGSNLLIQVLNSSSTRICCFSELFHPLARDLMSSGHFARPIVPYFYQSGMEVSEYLEQIVWGPQTANYSSVGLKVQLHFDMAYEAIAAAKELGAEFLYLTRLDKVEMVTSKLIAEATNQWWNYGQDTASHSLRIPPNKAKAEAERLLAAEQRMIEYLPKHTKVLTYEGLFQGGFEKVFLWLGCSATPNLQDATIPKQSSDKKLSIENFEEICQVIKAIYAGKV